LFTTLSSVATGVSVTFANGAMAPVEGQAKPLCSGAHKGRSPWAAHQAVAAATVAAAIAAILGAGFIGGRGNPPLSPAGELAELSIFGAGQKEATKLAAACAAGFWRRADTIKLENVDDICRKEE